MWPFCVLKLFAANIYSPVSQPMRNGRFSPERKLGVSRNLFPFLSSAHWKCMRFFIPPLTPKRIIFLPREESCYFSWPRGRKKKNAIAIYRVENWQVMTLHMILLRNNTDFSSYCEWMWSAMKTGFVLSEAFLPFPLQPSFTFHIFCFCCPNE